MCAMSRAEAPAFRVCFVCSANVARSPMAEAVVRAHIERAGLGGSVEVDSAGVDAWCVLGEAPARLTLEVLAAAGYASAHVARQFARDEFDDWDLVVGFDAGHVATLRRWAPDSAAKVRLLREFEPDPDAEDLEVPDLYLGEREDYEECLAMVEAAVPALLEAARRALVAQQRLAPEAASA